MTAPDDLSLPAGRYLSCAIDVQADNAGQTKALLMRNRIFAARAGVEPTVLSFGANSDLDERREVLLDRGLLTPGVDLANIYEDYRDTDWPGEVPTGEPLPDLSGRVWRETTLRDGTPWRRSHLLVDGSTVHDYLRPDGTTFLRLPRFTFKFADTWPARVLRVSRAGEVVGAYDGPGEWYREWVLGLTAEEERSFVFCDSRFLAPFLAPIDDPTVHLVYLLHNIHTGSPHRWDSPVNEVHDRLLSLIGRFDAFATLTERQRDDIAERYGRFGHMFVVPNPVDPPPVPDVVERDPLQVTAMARLVSQKRLGQAVAAMKHVVAEVPGARLDIYGDGPKRGVLEQVIARHGLEDTVTLKGHDPRARETLWRSSAFVMTSEYEGYPLSTLESMSHGCPVVSYDIKYGPREQVTDGVDGFVVPDGAVRRLAARISRLLLDPELVTRMGDAARVKAADHGYDRFLVDWVHIVRSAVEMKSRRTTIEDVELEVTRLEVGRSGRRGHAAPGVVPGRGRFVFGGRLTVHGHSTGSRLEDAVVTLSAVHEDTGVVVELPVEARLEQDCFVLACDVRLRELYPDGAAAGGRTHLRLRVVWHNSAWETVVRRTVPEAPGRAARRGVEVSFGPDGELALQRLV